MDKSFFILKNRIRGKMKFNPIISHCAKLLNFLLFLFFIILINFSINEILARQKVSLTIKSKIDLNNQKIVNLYEHLKNDNNNEIIKYIHFETTIYESMDTKVQNLINYGAIDSTSTLSSILKQLEFELKENIYTFVQSLTRFQNMARIDKSILEPQDLEIYNGQFSKYDKSVKFIHISRILGIPYLTSNLLLAIILITSCIIGVQINKFRYNLKKEEKSFTFSDILSSIFLGISTGFILFILIKGGRHFFIIEMDDNFFPINPFSASLAGLFGGLFTEKTYQLINLFFNSLIERVEKIVKK